MKIGEGEKPDAVSCNGAISDILGVSLSGGRARNREERLRTFEARRGAVCSGVQVATTDLPRSVVLLVCTANVCRSPMTQFVLADALEKADVARPGTIDVVSAGVHAEHDAPIAEASAALLAGRSLDSTGFRSRRLTPELVRSADLVLCAELQHRSLVVEMCPSASTYTFTLLEFAWLLGQVPASMISDDDTAVDRLSSLIAVARGQRGLQMPDRSLDLADPYGRRMGAYRRTLAQIDEAVAVIVDRLVPSASRP